MYNNIYMIICGLKATDPKWDAPPSSRNTFWCSTWGMGNGMLDACETCGLDHYSRIHSLPLAPVRIRMIPLGEYIKMIQV